MTTAAVAEAPSRQPADAGVRAALLLWLAFFAGAVLLNGTIPFLLGADLREWSASPLKAAACGLVIYGGAFLLGPLVLCKGTLQVRRPGFLLPLALALLALACWRVQRGVAALAVLVVADLHRRYDLSALGLRSRGWRGDAAAVLLLGGAGAVWALAGTDPAAWDWAAALTAGLDRLLANPAASVENLFYFGCMAERLSIRLGRLTPFVIAALYTLHEMSNPEYWYEGMAFAWVFISVVVTGFVYLWRRSVIVVWLASALARFALRLPGV